MATPQSFEQLIEEHGIWADATFPKGTAKGALLHAHREVDEIIKDIDEGNDELSIATEYADAMFCIMDSARRRGLTVNQIVLAGVAKLNKNKARTWNDNGDGSYSHVKNNQTP